MFEQVSEIIEKRLMRDNRASVDIKHTSNLQNNISKTFYSPREAPKSYIFELDQQKIHNKTSVTKAEKHYEDIKERMQNMKDEYRKNFVDINFYGM